MSLFTKRTNAYFGILGKSLCHRNNHLVARFHGNVHQICGAQMSNLPLRKPLSLGNPCCTSANFHHRCIIRKMQTVTKPPPLSRMPDNYDYLSCDDDTTLASLMNDMLVYENFISEEEEKSLLEEVEPYLKRLRYELDHWDNVSM